MRLGAQAALVDGRLVPGDVTIEDGIVTAVGVAGARGRGIASRALRLVSAWALDELGVGRLQLHADVENVPSQRVAERAGYVREGVVRGWIEMRGERRDHLVYSLLPRDERG